MSFDTFISALHSKLDTFFLISERNSTVWTEFRAGTAAFLTMSYLLLVNPQIMVQAGVSHDDAVFSTAISSAVSSLMVGIFGNLPFGLAPGLGLSAYLVFGLVLAGSADLQPSLTACLMSGLALGLCVMTVITNFIMKIVPRSIKLAIVVGMGFLVAMIGMVSVQLVVANPKTLVTLGDLGDLNLQICLVGIILVGSLVYHDVKGGVLIAIMLLTVIFWQLEQTYPTMIVDIPRITLTNYMDWTSLLDMSQAAVLYPAIAAFLFICIFDISGVMFGLSTLAGLQDEHGHIPNSVWVFYGSVVGTVIAALTGSTPIIVTVECAAGIKEGGKTGLTAVVISGYFLLSVFLAPLFETVPAEATAPVLVLVGAMMMGESGKIEWEKMNNAVPAFLTIVMMPLTYSITNGIVFGLTSAAAFYITTGKAFEEISEWYNLKKKKQAGDGDSNDTEGDILLEPTEQHDGKSGSVVSNLGAASPKIKSEFFDDNPLEPRPNFFAHESRTQENAVADTKGTNTVYGSVGDGSVI